MYDPIELRHALHRIPELAFREYKTQAFILKHLQELTQTHGVKELFEIVRFEHSTGILLVYNNAETDEAYQLFRADMDALPITEKSGAAYSSEHSGIMHACGHDVHMAVLLGLIQRVWITRPRQNLLFLFQPAEEGEGGAQSILSEGILQHYQIKSAYALHVAGDMPVGTVSSKAGTFFGIPQEFDVRFLGKAAHVAYPEKGVDALQCGINFINEIRKDIAKLPKAERVIFHVGKMNAGVIRNVIPDDCLLQGTHRSLNLQKRDQVNALIHRHAEQEAKRLGAKAEVGILGSYEPVVNDAELVERLKGYCKDLSYEFVPAGTVMAGEDFGFFTTLYPGLLFWLGSGSEHSLHSERFLPADESIPVGIDLMWALASGMTMTAERDDYF